MKRAMPAVREPQPRAKDKPDRAPAKSKVVVPHRPVEAPSDIPYYTTVGIDHNIRTLVRERQKTSGEIKELEEIKADLSGQILLMLVDAGQKSVGVDSYRVTVSEGRSGSKKINREKLALRLIKIIPADEVQALIDDCTEVGEPGKPFLVITDHERQQK